MINNFGSQLQNTNTTFNFQKCDFIQFSSTGRKIKQCIHQILARNERLAYHAYLAISQFN